MSAKLRDKRTCPHCGEYITWRNEQIEQLQAEKTKLLNENRDLRKANLSFAPVQIKQERKIKQLQAELDKLRDGYTHIRINTIPEDE